MRTISTKQNGNKKTTSMRFIVCLGICICSIFSLISRGSEQQAFVARRNEVRVFQRSDAQSPIITALKKGELVEASSRVGLFWKVSFRNNQIGYVMVFDLQKTDAPEAKRLREQVIEQQKAAQVHDPSVNQRSRAVNAVMGIRGLNRTNNENQSDANYITPNLKAVAAMEQRVIEKDQVRKREDLVLKEIEVLYQNQKSLHKETKGAEQDAEKISPDAYKETSTLQEDSSEKVKKLKSEMLIGRDITSRLLGYYAIAKFPKVTKIINEIGESLSSVTDAPERRFLFEILDDNSVNAFASPGGYILVTKGALLIAQNEAELAGILAHEMAHVVKQHMLITLQKKSHKSAAEKPESDGDKEIAARRRTTAADSDWGTFLAQSLLGGNAAANIVKTVDAGLEVLVSEGLDPNLEYEADAWGTQYLVRAGYDPEALKSVLQRLLAQKPEQQSTGMQKTHPSLASRLERLTVYLKSIHSEDIIGAKGKDRFEKTILLPLCDARNKKSTCAR